MGFDTDVDAQVRYRATKVHTWSDSDYDYTETSHYSVLRSGSMSFDHIPVDGSKCSCVDLFYKLIDRQRCITKNFLHKCSPFIPEECS